MMNKREISDLVISWLTVSLAFSLVIRNGLASVLGFPNDFLLAFVISTVSVGTGFIFHELAHRTVALKYGAQAEYRAWTAGLVLALFSALMGFVFAAPGAVYIYGQNITKKQNGFIALAGPITNGAVALMFMAIATTLSPNSILHLIVSYAAYINIFLGMFNMIPVPPLDGSKVIKWNFAAWLIVVIPLVAAFLLYRF